MSSAGEVSVGYKGLLVSKIPVILKYDRSSNQADELLIKGRTGKYLFLFLSTIY